MNSTTQPSLSIAIATMDTKRQNETHWIWLGAAVITAVFVLSNSATPLYVRWQHRFGFSAGMLTSIFAAYIGGLLGTLPFAGQLSDRFGRKPVILPALVLALVACGLFALAPSVAWLIVARLLTGVAVGVIVSAGMAAVIDVGGPENRKLASLASSVCMVFGAGAGPLLAGIVSAGFSGQGADPAPWIFSIEAIVLLGAMTIVWKMPLLRRVPHLKEGAQHRLHLPSIHRSNRGRLMQGIAVFAPGLASTSFVLALGPSLLSRLLHQNSPLIAGSMACAMFLTATGVQFATRRWHVRNIFLVGCAATATSMALLIGAVQLANPVLLLLGALCAGAGQGLGQLGGLTLLSLHVPDAHRAEAISLLNMGAYVVAGALPLSIGFVIDAIGLQAGTLAFGLVLLAAAAIAAGHIAAQHQRVDQARRLR